MSWQPEHPGRAVVTAFPIWFPIWERGVYSAPDRDHEVPAICWDHRDPHILADRLRRQILAAEMEGR